MLPGTHNITIYQGAAYGETLDCIQPDGSPVDLTGLSPFLAEVREKPHSPLILTIAVTDVDLNGGRVRLSAEAVDTDTLVPAIYYWGLLDSQRNLLLLGTCTIAEMIPEP